MWKGDVLFKIKTETFCVGIVLRNFSKLLQLLVEDVCLRFVQKQLCFSALRYSCIFFNLYFGLNLSADTTDIRSRPSKPKVKILLEMITVKSEFYFTVYLVWISSSPIFCIFIRVQQFKEQSGHFHNCQFRGKRPPLLSLAGIMGYTIWE